MLTTSVGNLSKYLKLIFKFIFPLAVWCYLYRGFLWGDLRVSEDTFAVYAVVKYFLANIKMGVFAHWNPFIHWGMGHVCQIGEFNPLWALALLFNSFGMDIYHAFLWTVVAYLFVGAFGLYCLLRLLFAEKFLAYFGFVIFLFSAAGMTVFTQVTLILIFVPAIWFFYFLTYFYHHRSLAGVLFLSFTLMLIATTYIPFYFIISLLCVMLLGGILYFGICRQFFVKIYEFIRLYPQAIVMAVIAVFVSILASFLNWFFLRTDFMVLARPAILTYETVKGAGISIAEILRDSSIFHFFIYGLQVPILTYARDIFSYKNLTFDNQRIFYIPVIAHLILLAAMFVRLNKHVIFYGALCFTLFLIAIAQLSPVYHFLFSHVMFFHMFRNIFLLIPFIIAAYIVLSLEQFRLLWLEGNVKRYGFAVWVLFILGAFVVFWCRSGTTFYSTYITAGVLALLLLLRFTGLIHPHNRFAFGLLVLLAMLQPIEVLSAHADKFKEMGDVSIIKEAARMPLGVAKFSYTRPLKGTFDYTQIKPNDIYRLYSSDIIAMKDAEGFFTFNYGYPTKWSYLLAKSSHLIPGFEDYVRHKFVIYDQFDASQSFDSIQDFAQWFVVQPSGIAMDSPSHEFLVNHFDANQVSLKTNFASKKFLVYNDSYHPQWNVEINGKKVNLYRANFAFKGVWVPAGASNIKFQFEPIGGSGIYMGIMIFFYLYFIVCAVTFYSERRKIKI